LLSPSMNSPFLIGLDLSLSRTGVAWQSEPSGFIGSKTLSPPKGIVNGERLKTLQKQFFVCLHQMISLATSEQKILAAVEDYARGGSGQRHGLAEWGGIVRVMLAERDIPLLVVNPSTLKLYIAGNGHAEKHDMALAVRNRTRTGQEFSTDDACDAAALVLYLRDRITLPRPQVLRRQSKRDAALWGARWAGPDGMVDDWKRVPVRVR
jgi:Holliday junction resolvasome RuvABC endonuclease subunit